MTKLVFALLLTTTSGGVGLALVSAWLHIQLHRLDNDVAHKALLVVRLGMAMANGVLIYALGLAGPDLPVNFRSWLYLLGVLVMTVGFWWEVKINIGRLAVIENELEKEHANSRMTAMEARLTHEEARNTDIEAAARQAMRRADAAEKREDER